MDIQPVASGTLAALTPAENRAVEEIIDPVENKAVETEAVEPKKLPGVLRMLQEGKFSGVADVRLRIVHAEKLAALGAAETQKALTESADALVASVASTVAELADASADFDPEQVDLVVADFATQLASAIDTFSKADKMDVESFAASLQGAFQSLLEQLGLGAVAEDGDSRDYLAELTATFDAGLNAILESANNKMTMPPLSEANGNGRAYDKFVAIYNELQGKDRVVDDPAKSRVDIVT